MPTLEMVLVISLTFLLAGGVKGVLGLGLPTLSLGVLAAVIGLTEAMALMLIPAFVTNVWQGLVGGALAAIMRRLWPMLFVVCIGTWIGAGILAGSDTTLLSGMLGLLLCI